MLQEVSNALALPSRIHAIQAAFSDLRRGRNMRHRDIARQLYLSEGELLAAHTEAACVSTNVSLCTVRLRPDWPAIVKSLEPLGEVMALTRNESCVHEKTGVYRRASHSNNIGMVSGGAIDLRLFYRHWVHGFAVSEQTETGMRRSLQFFNAAGSPIHKVYLRPSSNVVAYERLVRRFADPIQVAGIKIIPAPAPITDRPDAAIDATAFNIAWARMRDIHEFFGLLKTFAISHLQGLRLAAPHFAQRVDKACVLDLLSHAVREGIALMALVGNPGMIQVHRGPVTKAALTGPWIKVLDTSFNLHVREEHIASVWVVKKPTVDGLVTSLELFDLQGNIILTFLAERNLGLRERCEWRAMVGNALRKHELRAA